ncbi:hypothetical protein BXZ70DRAFT_912040 [Cristinia sonorae]|uniref:C2H2-type domain-containing protein n=1 Tax=Cristinia sonorae TaxID=1940300 RepID=A0A8K0XUH2_9AGAR|nr:hypothetical protein BXZ70DRAFT_912040 [Cristinia sonorae]
MDPLKALKSSFTNIKTKARQSASDRLAAFRASADKDKLSLYAEVKEVHDIKRLAPPTVRRHELVKRRYRIFVADDNEQNGENLPIEIEPPATFPTIAQCKRFIVFLAVTTKGKRLFVEDGSDELLCRTTMTNYLYSFFALWSIHANVVVPKETRNQLLAFIGSERFLSQFALRTKSKPKANADHVDVDILLAQLLNPSSDNHFSANHSRFVVHYAIALSALSAERPGAVVESGAYRKSNESIKYSEHQVHIVPNQDPTLPPYVCLVVTFNLLKNGRTNDSKFKSIIIRPDLESPSSCALMSFLTLAFLDNAFADVSTPEEIFDPKIRPVRGHILQWKPEMMAVNVLRTEELVKKSWKVSDTQALPYSTYIRHLTYLSLKAGFVRMVKPYDTRRAMGEAVNEAKKDSQRRQVMAHDPNSEMWESYVSKLVKFDFQSLFRRREEDGQWTAVFANLARVSFRADASAPDELPFDARQELHSAEELVELRALVAEKQAQLVAHNARAPSSDDNPLFSEWKSQQARLIQDIALLERSHRDIFARESHYRTEVERALYFREGSRRTLLGEVAAPQKLRSHIIVPEVPPVHDNVEVPSLGEPLDRLSADNNKDDLAMTGNNEDDGSFPLGFIYDTLDDMNRPMDDLRAAFFNPPTTVPYPNAIIVNTINAALRLPRNPAPPCFPGEPPTLQGKCPVCRIDVITDRSAVGNRGAGNHIHSCISKECARVALVIAESDYVPQKCRMVGCKKRSEDYKTRADFTAHIRVHIQALSSTVRKDSVCRWEVGSTGSGIICGQDGEDDWYAHFARVHEFNPRATLTIHYCLHCGKRFVDWSGHDDAWEIHCERHYIALFQQWEQRDSQSLMKSTTGPVIAHTNTVEYKSGSGFDGEMPEFHGHVESMIAIHPMYCPFCVYDESKPWKSRMTQFTIADSFVRHLRDEHRKDIGSQLCPVPACGPTTLTFEELMTHLITVHRLPMYGYCRASSVERLKLPPTTTDIPSTKGPTLEELRVAKRRQRKANKVKGWCYGCYRPLQDIFDHLAKKSPDSKCGKQACYSLFDSDDKRIEDKLTYTKEFNDRPATKKSRSENHHFCMVCEQYYSDIRLHVEFDSCPCRTFKIRDPETKSMSGVLNVRAWLQNQSAMAGSSDVAESSGAAGPSGEAGL